MGRPLIPMIGKNFGCSKVIGESEKSTARRKIYITQCSLCGNQKEMFGENIRRIEKEKSPGCGCVEKNIKNRISDKGEFKHPLYSTWDSMMRRCYKENNYSFKNYGGRGIKVCDAWHDATNFFKWADENYLHSEKLQLDRIDNNGDYSPDNCRFVTQMQNSNNKRNNRRLSVFGESLTVAEASRKFGIKYTTIRCRLDMGWGDEKAVSKK